MERQVLSIGQMQHLKELGIDTGKASMCWLRFGERVRLSVHDGSSPAGAVPAFTLQDMMEILPYRIGEYFLFFQKDRYAFRECDCYKVYYRRAWGDIHLKDVREDSLLGAMYKMLCWCIEKEYIKG